MNLHFELNGLDWRGTGSKALTANTDLFWEGVSDEIVTLYERSVDIVPALLENAWATLWIAVGEYDLLIYSVADAGAHFPTDQANAGLDVVLVSDGEAVKRDQSVHAETAARAVFDVLAYAARRNLGPDSAPAFERHSRTLSVVVTDRQLAARHLPTIETLDTEMAQMAQEWAVQGAGLSLPHRDLAIVPPTYWPETTPKHANEFTDAKRDELHSELADHCDRSREQQHEN